MSDDDPSLWHCLMADWLTGDQEPGPEASPEPDQTPSTRISSLSAASQRMARTGS